MDFSQLGVSHISIFISMIGKLKPSTPFIGQPRVERLFYSCLPSSLLVLCVSKVKETVESRPRLYGNNLYCIWIRSLPPFFHYIKLFVRNHCVEWYWVHLHVLVAPLYSIAPSHSDGVIINNLLDSEAQLIHERSRSDKRQWWQCTLQVSSRHLREKKHTMHSKGSKDTQSQHSLKSVCK